MLEHLVYIQRVGSSNLSSSTNGYQSRTRLSETGGNGDNKIGNWEYCVAAITADCKSALIRVRRFESFYSHISGFSSIGRVSSFQVESCRFESYIFYNWEYRIAAIAADCKSALIRVQWFESTYSHNLVMKLTR